MGADLYIHSKFDANQAISKPLFEDAVKRRNAATTAGKLALADEIQADVIKYHDAMYDVGYFRDSYNTSLSLCVIGLSYWELSEELDIGEDGLTPDKAKIILERIEERTEDVAFDLHFAEWVKVSRGRGIKFRGEGETVKEWNVYHKAKLARLAAFLKEAIELNEAIGWSV